ncbi:MAG TPA: BolA family transcriptional regulator [Gammaproteobacteria bacterium]|nr:BolA family transcriptional regulator [Gammaproteobacteria bacterium]|tara:strand:+ start:215 stop:466 length:252 start_codon:yes stop_codon:yes gene_type:complete
MTGEEIKMMIESGIPEAEAYVDGDGSHFVAQVVSDSFVNCPMIKQHKMVYATLGDSMESAIHALSIQTYTREAWEKARKLKVM